MLVGEILAHAHRIPTKTALVYNEEPLTYGQLARAVGGLCDEIKDTSITGVGIVVVAISDLRASWLACLALRFLGITTLALSSIDLLPSLCLTGLRGVVRARTEQWPGLADACVARDLPLVTLAFDRNDADLLAAPARAEGGHILQTSGTTGVPKHVLYDPTFEPGYFQKYCEIAGIDDSAVFGAFHFPLWTAAGYRAPFATLLAGGTVILQSGRPPHYVLKVRSLTSATVTPAMLRGILDAPVEAFSRNPNLRFVISSGTAALAEVEAAQARISPLIEIRIGTTEAQIVASTFVRTADDIVWHKPASGVRVEVVDGADRVVQSGQTGHLRVATEGGPAGYCDDLETTAAFFRDGFFYPGDLAIPREDGRLLLQGRVTDIINVNGYKRVPAPVEDSLSHEFGLRGLCLLSLVTDSNVEDLFVVAESDVPLDHAALGIALRRELGSFPNAHIFITPQLPRNTMGKIMREAVKAQIISSHPAFESRRAKPS